MASSVLRDKRRYAAKAEKITPLVYVTYHVADTDGYPPKCIGHTFGTRAAIIANMISDEQLRAIKYALVISDLQGIDQLSAYFAIYMQRLVKVRSGNDIACININGTNYQFIHDGQNGCTCGSVVGEIKWSNVKIYPIETGADFKKYMRPAPTDLDRYIYPFYLDARFHQLYPDIIAPEIQYQSRSFNSGKQYITCLCKLLAPHLLDQCLD